MKRSFLEIYALAVCFVSVICLIISSGIGIFDIVQLSKPEFTISPHQYSIHQSNEAFAEHLGTEKKPAEEDTLTSRRLESYKHRLWEERRNAAQSLVKVAITILVFVAAFVLHWRLARRVRFSAPTD